MYKSPFSINVVAHMAIPHRHRTPRFIAWVKVSLAWLTMIKADLYDYWDESIDDASMTPQVKYLERLLNLKFDRTDIYIDEGFTLGPWVWNNEEEPDPEFYMDTEDDSWVYGDGDAAEVDFVVHIPPAVETSVPQIAALVHKYKLPGMCFIIQKDV